MIGRAPRRRLPGGSVAGEGRTKEELLAAVRELEGRVAELEERAGRTARAEAELAAGKARLESILDTIPDIVYELDLAGRVLFANRPASEALGVPLDRVGSITMLEVLRAADAERAARAIARMLAGGPGLRDEPFELLTASGDVVPVEVNATRLAHLDGPPTVLGIARDVRERKRAEEERESLQEQLRFSQKMEAVGRLAGGVAHDFNNVLTGVLGYTALILCALGEDDPVAEDVREIAAAARRAASLTGQLLAFSRKQLVAPRVLALNDLVSSSARMLERLVGEDVRLGIDLDPALAPVLADPGQVDQVLVNLVVNSRDAMPNGGELTISTRNVEVGPRPAGLKPGAYVELAVEDSGHGMDRETLSRAFEPFFSTKPRGTGLGLSTVYGLVEGARGKVEIDSAPGSGTRIRVLLPATEGRPVEAPPQPAEALGGREAVLLVEDDAMVRRLARRLLAARGYAVIEASGGGDALLRWDEVGGEVDLLVTDVVMPAMSGKQLHERLLARRPGLRVLYMSGYTDEAVAQHGVLEPDTPFLHKPFTSESLAAAVRAALDR